VNRRAATPVRSVRRTPLPDARVGAEPEPRGGLGCRCVMVPIVLAVIGYVAFGSPLFAIRRVDWQGPEECRAIAEESVPVGANLFAFRTGPLVASLRGEAVVDSVRVMRIPPGTLRVVVTPRTPFLRVRVGLGATTEYVSDRSGRIFALAEKGGQLPLVVGEEVQSLRDWQLTPAMLSCCTTWLDLGPKCGLPRIVKILYRGDGMANLTLENGVLLKVGSTEDAERKLEAANALLPGLTRDVEYIDLELADLAAVGHKHAAVVASESSAESSDDGKANATPARKRQSGGAGSRQPAR
jgi:cell division septal protein FtsQ